MTMKVHVQRICQTSFYQLRQLRSVRRSLSVNACTALVHAFVISRLDYCNSLLAGIGEGLIDQLQTVLRVAARLVLRKRKFDPISADIRDRLHWLPIRSRIDFKLGLLVYKCLHGTAPAYPVADPEGGGRSRRAPPIEVPAPRSPIAVQARAPSIPAPAPAPYY